MKYPTYQNEWVRQRSRTGLPSGHLPVHRWYLRIDEPWHAEVKPAPKEGTSIVRAVNPAVNFYRYLYHTAGEEFIWGDRRRMNDQELELLVNRDDVHVMVLYDRGTPAGFFELDFRASDISDIKYFALLPGFLGQGLGGYMLSQAIQHSGRRQLPLTLDTCTLDHFAALENYRKHGFEIIREQDEEYPDPRLEGIIPRSAGKHVPLAE